MDYAAQKKFIIDELKKLKRPAEEIRAAIARIDEQMIQDTAPSGEPDPLPTNWEHELEVAPPPPPMKSAMSPLIPILMAATLVATWGIRFQYEQTADIMQIAAVVSLLTILFVVGAYKTVHQNWRTTFNDTSASISFAFLVIGLFGAGYALCEVFIPGSLNKDQLKVVYLGYPFLLSTSIGIAGGIFGEPTRAPQIIAHVQLLLFLTGLALVFARLLRLEVKR